MKRAFVTNLMLDYAKKRLSSVIFTLSIALLSFSCSENTNKSSEYVESEGNDNLMQYTSFVDVSHYKSGYYINVKSPWSEGSLGEFYLYPDSLQLPEELVENNVIRTPVKSVVAYSSTQWSVFLKLNEIQRVKGILESNYSNNKEIARLLADGEMLDIGTEAQLNKEKVIEIQPDVILYTPYRNISSGSISELTGAAMFPFADYLESQPLGRAEWLKIIGFLTCREKDTYEWFDSIVNSYESIKSLCENVEERPTVFSDLPFDGQWYLPGGKSYIAQIFSDAGADYVWKDNNSTASQPVEAETILVRCSDADYWRIMNSTDVAYSYERLAIENELFTYFNAFKNHHVIVCDIRKSSYFETSQYEPDILLKDFVKVFHPELVDGDYEPKYFYLLNE